ncbi:LPXTG cell wall anchor domain-containing protein [Amycolatopsis sp. NPDC059021]|uniref:LPXTG cell wall anchor domain-containing protein n=1 Tax=Amycolatopsis sp. NPDC059021 TaxID=3346704 RepID=UPI00366D307A
MSRRSVRAALSVAALTTVTLLGTATAAFACHSDDDRANPTPDNVSTCVAAKLPGALLDESALTFTGGTDKDKYLSITAVAEGVKVTAIVVKGGDGYNIYEPGKRGLAAKPPWEKLRSPLNNGGQQATISHWFACGSKETPTSQPSAPKPPETSAPGKPSEAPASSAAPSSAAPSTSDTAAPTSSAVAAPAGNSSGGNGGGLANTGFDNGWLIWVGALLLLGGAGLLTLLKLRRRSS